MQSKLITYKGRTRRLWNVNITTPIELSKIRTALFHKNTKLNKYVTEFSIKIYNQMLAGNRRCELNIALYEPMDTVTAESENKRNTKLAQTTSNIIGTAVVAPISAYNIMTAGVTGLAVKAYAFDKILNSVPDYQLGDIAIVVDARVSGGIGKQHSIRTLIVNRNKYDPNHLTI